MAERFTEKKLLKLIETHSKDWNKVRNENLSKIIFNVMKDLKIPTNDERDGIVSMFFVNNDLNQQINDKVKEIKAEKDELNTINLLNELFDIQNANIHIENVLGTLHTTKSFEQIYKKDQFYHSIHRFVQSEMTVPEGFNFIYAYQTLTGEVKHLVVKVDAEVELGKLFDSAFFGFMMEEPKNKEERITLVNHVLSFSNVDILTEKQTEELSGKDDVEVFTSSELVEKHHEVGQVKLAVQ